jgi:ATP-binding cassette subfamily D (ALD) long-chain fatty acid import protein
LSALVSSDYTIKQRYIASGLLTEVTRANMDPAAARKVLRRSLRQPISAKTINLLRGRLKDVLDIYLQHRPVIQQLLTAGFVAYCLGTTYLGVTGRAGKTAARESSGGGGRRSRKGECGERGEEVEGRGSRG